MKAAVNEQPVLINKQHDCDNKIKLMAENWLEKMGSDDS